MTSSLKANYVLKTNIDALLVARNKTRKDLAQWCRRSESWISKIFRNPRREMPMKYLDRISDVLGVETYELFRPGFSESAERRSGRDRRSGHERRVNDAQRILRSLDATHAKAHPRRETLALSIPEVQLIEHLRQQPGDTLERVLGLVSGIREPRQKARRKSKDAIG